MYNNTVNLIHALKWF